MWYRLVLSSVQNAIDQQIKSMLRNSPFVQKLFANYGVNIKEAWRLHFQIAELHGKLAQTKGDLIMLDPKVVENGVEAGLHYVIHEITHWLTRQKEQDQYFADPEEIRGFEWAMAHEISNGKGIKELEQTFLPLILPHFPNEGEARSFFIQRLAEARRIASK